MSSIFIINKHILFKYSRFFYLHLKNWLLQNEENGYILEHIWKLILDNENPTGKFVDLTAEEIKQKETESAEYENGAFDRALDNLRIKRNKLLSEKVLRVIFLTAAY